MNKTRIRQYILLVINRKKGKEKALLIIEIKLTSVDRMRTDKVKKKSPFCNHQESLIDAKSCS